MGGAHEHSQQWQPNGWRLLRRALLPPSGQANIIVGLDLLRLLVQNRIAEFHTELELLPPEVRGGGRAAA